MTTKDDLIKQDNLTEERKWEIENNYPEGWSIKCSSCGHYNCHKYQDGWIVCFHCKVRIKDSSDKVGTGIEPK
jgi:hypothetical protein